MHFTYEKPQLIFYWFLYRIWQESLSKEKRDIICNLALEDNYIS